MVEDELLTILDEALLPLAAVAEEGGRLIVPSLDVLRYYARPVRLSWMPILGRGLSVVAVVRQPVDLGFSAADYRKLLERVAITVNHRFPPWPLGRSLSVALTTIVMTPEPIGPEDDARLQQSLHINARLRAVPLGLLRLNLGQEAMSFAVAQGPSGLYPEPLTVADALTARFRRFVPLVADEGPGRAS
jgi:hypothetical protein